MKNIILLTTGVVLFILHTQSATGQSITRKRTYNILRADSLNKVYTRANHALREIGFRVTQANRRKTRVLLERNVGSWFYQTLISRKPNKVDVEIFYFTGPSFRLSWTYPEKQLPNVETIFNVIDFRLRNGEPIPPIMLANSMLWGIEIDYNPPKLSME